MNTWFRFPLWLRSSVLVSCVLLVPLLQISSLTAVYAQSSSALQTHAHALTPPTPTVFRGHTLPGKQTGHHQSSLPYYSAHPLIAPQHPVDQYCAPQKLCDPPVLNPSLNPVLHHPHVVLIFWGPAWGDTHNQHYQTYAQIVNSEIKLFSKLAGSQYNTLLIQYVDATGRMLNDKHDPIFQGAAIAETSPPSPITPSDEANVIEATITQYPVWANLADALFMLFPQEGSTYNDASLQGTCGYHHLNNNQRLYSVEPYLTDAPFSTGCLPYGTKSLVNAMTVVASAEYAGNMTDPLLNAWATAQGFEIGALCAGQYVKLTELGGVTVQNLFDRFVYTHDPSQGCDTAGGDQVWRYQTGGSVGSAPAVVKGVVYVGSNDDYIYALNASTGSLLWRYKTGGWVTSSPTVVKGVLYVGSYDHNVYALKASNGSLLCRYQTGDAVESSPTVVNNVLYIGSNDHYVYAINASTCALLWRYQTGSYVSSAPAVVNGVVYVGSEDDYVYALTASNGTLLWRYQTGNIVRSPLTVVNGVAYFDSYDHYIYALNASNGSLLWRYQMGDWAESKPVVVNGVLYVGSGDYNVYALNASNGTLIWHYKTQNYVESTPAVANGVVYIGSWDTCLYALKASDGSLDWCYKTGNYVWSSPAVANSVVTATAGLVYIGSNDGSLYAFKAF